MSDLTLIDTNPLVHSIFESDQHHAACKALLTSAADPAAGLCVAPQNLTEFYRVVTSPRVDRPLSAEEATDALGRFLRIPGLLILPQTPAVPSILHDLLTRRPVTNVDIFDYQLIATMLANDVTRVYTYNTDDFTWVDELEVLEPRPYGEAG